MMSRGTNKKRALVNDSESEDDKNNELDVNVAKENRNIFNQFIKTD